MPQRNSDATEEQLAHYLMRIRSIAAMDDAAAFDAIDELFCDFIWHHDEGYLPEYADENTVSDASPSPSRASGYPDYSYIHTVRQLQQHLNEGSIAYYHLFEAREAQTRRQKSVSPQAEALSEHERMERAAQDSVLDQAVKTFYEKVYKDAESESLAGISSARRVNSELDILARDYEKYQGLPADTPQKNTTCSGTRRMPALQAPPCQSGSCGSGRTHSCCEWLAGGSGGGTQAGLGGVLSRRDRAGCVTVIGLCRAA